MVLPPCTTDPISPPDGTVGVFYDYTAPGQPGGCASNISELSVPGLTGIGIVISGTPTTPGVFGGHVCCGERIPDFPCTGFSSCGGIGVPFTITIGAPSWPSGGRPPMAPPVANNGATVNILLASGATGTTAITFNGTNAPTFTVVDDATIAVVIPNGATSGPIRTTNPAGTALSTIEATIIPPYAPQVGVA